MALVPALAVCGPRAVSCVRVVAVLPTHWKPAIANVLRAWQGPLVWGSAVLAASAAAAMAPGAVRDSCATCHSAAPAPALLAHG